ncbi:uncharacterized protein LOC134839114 [Symsagittifera roscoffensis]|uniref:uncharacterized protein LOC134839114 n=1 Tax=Symsagittifera roscoffensis TaxID=84072 RepID=UPI00307B98BE
MMESSNEDGATFTIQLACNEDLNQMTDLILYTFMKQEPMTHSILRGKNLETTYGDAVRKTVETSIKERASTVAKLPEVAGLTITISVSLSQYLEFRTLIPEFAGAFKALYEARCEDLPEKFLRLRLVTVSEKFQRRGTSGKLVDDVINRAKQNGDLAIVAEATGIYSQRIFANRGFRCISELKYSEYKDEKGDVVFKGTAPHSSLKLVVLNV